MQHGTQTFDDLFGRDSLVIDGLQGRLTHATESFTRRLRSGAECPVTRWHTGQIAFSDSWSVRLRNRGFQKNPYHSHDWLSSALCLIVPAVVSAGGKEGWIKFGEPGFRAREPLSPEHWLQPKESALAIFPSYLWHRTESPQNDVERMNVDFDALPAPT